MNATFISKLIKEGLGLPTLKRSSTAIRGYHKTSQHGYRVFTPYKGAETVHVDVDYPTREETDATTEQIASFLKSEGYTIGTGYGSIIVYS